MIFYPEKLTRASKHLANLLEQNNSPVLTQFRFFEIISNMYKESCDEKLYLRHETPDIEDYKRLRSSLKNAGIIGADQDYGSRVIRVFSIPDLSADNIICLIDYTCYISHLSAMQRWGLTDRNPKSLILTRPDRKRMSEQLKDYMNDDQADTEHNLFPLKIIKHPDSVRHRPVHIYESKAAGEFLQIRGESVRLSTIGQTFLDMLQKPELCGGMSHIIDVWDKHAKTFLDEIIVSVDGATSKLVKSRAGYILEELLELKHPNIELWKLLGQRGSSRKLDPHKDFSSNFSETWMISINA